MTTARRRRSVIATMLYSFARVGPIAVMTVGATYALGKRKGLRLTEKGGKHHGVPAHHLAQEVLGAYIEVGAFAGRKAPLFQSVSRSGDLTGRGLGRNPTARMVERRARGANPDGHYTPHSLRATGITIYMENGGTLENAQAIAAHESPRTTKLYDRTSDTLSLDEIERITL